MSFLNAYNKWVQDYKNLFKSLDESQCSFKSSNINKMRKKNNKKKNKKRR